jgi:probable rRNA maturation factor
MTDILISVTDERWLGTEGLTAAVEAAAQAALKGAGLTDPASSRAELSIDLSDDASIQTLNRDYREKDKPTNVLSFPGFEDIADLDDRLGADGPPLLLGDVILAYETVTREAGEQGKPLLDHVRHLTVHGVLHLMGHDHEDEAEAKQMEALERSILLGLGVPDPYLTDFHFPDIVETNDDRRTTDRR